MSTSPLGNAKQENLYSNLSSNTKNSDKKIQGVKSPKLPAQLTNVSNILNP